MFAKPRGVGSITSGQSRCAAASSTATASAHPASSSGDSLVIFTSTASNGRAATAPGLSDGGSWRAVRMVDGHREHQPLVLHHHRAVLVPVRVLTGRGPV